MIILQQQAESDRCLNLITQNHRHLFARLKKQANKQEQHQSQTLLLRSIRGFRNKQTKKKVHWTAEMGSGAGSFLKVLFKNFDVLAGPVISLLYPLYASVRAIESESRADDRQWLTYWVLYSMITLLELTFAKVIEWIPIWSYAKLIFTCWLVIPYFSGAAYVYEHYLRPFFMNPQQTINIWYLPGKKDLFKKPDDILTAAERYMEEHGTGAFENLIRRADRSRSSGFINDDDGYRH
ncbi:hypothetical protein PTKIN_Ptkin05aG0169000 [Pterospermum kingtungense]